MKNVAIKQDGYVVWGNKAITKKDYSRLINQLTEDVGKTYIQPTGLHSLYLLLANSKKYESLNIPDNIVTINSKIILTSGNNQKQLVKIVLPEDIKCINDISVYSPIGIACLGSKEMDNVYAKYKNSTQKLKIEKIVFQPEKEKILYL